MKARVSKLKERPQPFLLPQLCKGCGRCIESCPKDCIHYAEEIDPATGLIPVVIDMELCTGCGVCASACPEPYGMQMFDRDEMANAPRAGYELQDPAHLFGPRPYESPVPEAVPWQELPLPQAEPLIIKGTYASAIGAVLAGCRHFYGYPITPSTEGAELMARLQPKLNGIYFQAVSEVATVNHMYGTAGAGLPTMTFTSSPGFSLMLEGISYMIGAELPGVFVNVMRGGPGLGNIGPEQADIKLACKGLGHGNTQALVLAPSTPQEMLDLTMLAFQLSFRYRNPVIVLGDGYLGQITGKVHLPDKLLKPGLPEWAVSGDREHRGNVICSIALSEAELEEHNIHLNAKYARMESAEQRADLFRCEQAEVVLVAANTPSRMAKGAVEALRQEGIAAGLFRPVTLWPFPVDALRPLLGGARRLVVVEASNGQLEDELRLALDKACLAHPPIDHVRRFGGMLPQHGEILEKVRQTVREEVPA